MDHAEDLKKISEALTLYGKLMRAALERITDLEDALLEVRGTCDLHLQQLSGDPENVYAWKEIT